MIALDRWRTSTVSSLANGRDNGHLSYRDVGAFDNFAQRGHVVAEYPADTLLIDDYRGIEIQFDSLDNDLDEITFLEAQQDRLLVFVGDKILSAWNPQLIAAGRYRLWVIRARFDTKRATHAADAKVWVALRDDLDTMNAFDSTMISTARLTRLCGLRETRLRELAEEGWIPKAHRREHLLAPTIVGLLRYYREREQSQDVQDVYESFEDCSAAVGIPLKVLKRAKRKGCPALRHNRVRLPALIRWYYESRGQQPVDLEVFHAQHAGFDTAKSL